MLHAHLVYVTRLGVVALVASLSSCRACDVEPESGTELPGYFIGVPRDRRSATVRDLQGGVVGTLDDPQLFRASSLERTASGQLRLFVSDYGYGAWVDASTLEFCPSRLDVSSLAARVLAAGQIEHIDVQLGHDSVTLDLDLDLFGGFESITYTCADGDALPHVSR